jgi:hypothetical protein
MTKEVLGIALALAVGLVGACGSNSNDNEQVTPACVRPSDPGCRIIVDEHSFVRWTGAATDGVVGGVSTAVVRHAPGRYCMSGTVDAGADGSGWGAILTIGLVQVDEATHMLITPFDAVALGVAQVRFSVEDPPASGVIAEMTQVQSTDCKTIPDCVMSFDWPNPITSAGTFTVSLDDFDRPDQAGAVLDHTLISGLHFYVPTVQGTALDYDFCVDGVAFLDAAGRELAP